MLKPEQQQIADGEDSPLCVVNGFGTQSLSLIAVAVREDVHPLPLKPFLVVPELHHQMGWRSRLSF